MEANAEGLEGRPHPAEVLAAFAVPHGLSSDGTQLPRYALVLHRYAPVVIWTVLELHGGAFC